MPMLQDSMMSFALLGAEWVMWLLVALSLICTGLTLERLVSLWTSGTNRQQLANALTPFMAGGSVEALASALNPLKGCEALVLKMGIEMADSGPLAVEKAMIGAATAEQMKMERGLSVLATVGANAPFVGLFGTVLGVIQAFNDLSLHPNDASQAVMAGIAEALVATAIGLLVAIPAVVVYNGLNRWVRSRMKRIDSLADLILAKLHAAQGRTNGQ
jgi:biopolymer transport protein ExbB